MVRSRGGAADEGRRSSPSGRSASKTDRHRRRRRRRIFGGDRKASVGNNESHNRGGFASSVWNSVVHWCWPTTMNTPKRSEARIGRGARKDTPSGQSASKTDRHRRRRRRRRRRIFGGDRKAPVDNNESHNRGGFASSVWNSVVQWSWHTTVNTPKRSEVRIGRGARKADRVGVAADTDSWTSKGIAGGVLLLLAIALAMTLFRLRWRSGVGTAGPHREAKEKGSDKSKSEAKLSKKEQEGDEDQESELHHGISSRVDRATRARNEFCPLGTTTGDTLPAQSEQQRNSRNAVIPTANSGERRVSLYDVLAGEAPLLPWSERAGGVSAAPGGAFATVDMARGEGIGGVGPLGPLGGARRASIFDRIMDVVFNEENEGEDPVDADAVRQTLEDEFRVSLREGTMGMTLCMDEGTRCAQVNKITPEGQAFRAGVRSGDIVIGVGDHNVTSYGTVLAFMNILGRPIELRFRKVDSTREGSSSSAEKKAAGHDGSGGAATPQGSPMAIGPASLMAAGRSRGHRSRERSFTRKTKGAHQEGSKAPPLSPISPRSMNRMFSGLSEMGLEVASSDSGFRDKMERGMVVTKYGKKGAVAQRVLFLDGPTKSLAWRDLSARSPDHRRPPCLTNMLKGQREVLALSHLVEVVAGDEPDPVRPSLNGSSILREHCDETLLERSFALQFRERSLEMTCDSKAEMRQLVTGFRDLQRQLAP